MRSFYIVPNPPEGGLFRRREVVPGGKPQQLISKDIVVRRIRAEGKLASMRQLIAGMTVDDQFEFAHLTQLNPADTRLRAGITNIGLDPDVILAP